MTIFVKKAQVEKAELFRVGMAYTKSLLSYKFDGKPMPFSASFAITNRCNLKCVYCEYPNMKTKELKLDEIDILFNRLKTMGVKRLGLLGGEPMTRKDFGEIISLAKSKGFSLSLNTNLLLYDRFKEKLKGVDYFFTSLDGTKEKHLANRGKQDYEAIIEAIRDIRRSGRPVTAICVLTSPDIESVKYLIDLATKENFTVHFQQECYDALHSGNQSPIEIDQDAIRGVWDYIYHQKKAGKPITSSIGYIEYIKQWEDYRKTAVYDPQETCAAGRGYIFIAPDGKAYPCPYVQGDFEGVDMLKNDWAEMFNGETPCTKCIVGAMLEFTLLFKKPVVSIRNAMGNLNRQSA